jgi:ketosteroid isomerase-like protein
MLLAMAACSDGDRAAPDVVEDAFPVAQAEIREAVMSIKRDIESANTEGLRGVHLDSEKFTKFGPRTFGRQDVSSTNESETVFFKSIADANYRVRDLKIDVFDDVGIATYYPEVKFKRDGKDVMVSGRQTLVFLRTGGGWKLVHEHGTVRTD